ncbi:hypothetical protein [Dyella sp. M7H15-1]|uniref:hypothetical protein n=1 Tax=Dyella sp. M7H15-1 TaxID=2501295 RepID=UPI0013E8AEAF|nr:hypothetical protein [Dyella sp. M7H15-1]
MRTLLKGTVLVLFAVLLAACSTSGQQKPPKACTRGFVPINMPDHHPATTKEKTP